MTLLWNVHFSSSNEVIETVAPSRSLSVGLPVLMRGDNSVTPKYVNKNLLAVRFVYAQSSKHELIAKIGRYIIIKYLHELGQQTHFWGKCGHLSHWHRYRFYSSPHILQKRTGLCSCHFFALLPCHLIFYTQGKVNLVQGDNWVVYHFWNRKQHRFEMGILELFEPKMDWHTTSFSSRTAPLPEVTLVR